MSVVGFSHEVLILISSGISVDSHSCDPRENYTSLLCNHDNERASLLMPAGQSVDDSLRGILDPLDFCLSTLQFSLRHQSRDDFEELAHVLGDKVRDNEPPNTDAFLHDQIRVLCNQALNRRIY